MAAKKIRNENSIEGLSNIAYQVRKFQETSTTFNYFFTQLVSTGFLVSGNILICDNSTIHLTEENKNLADIHWKEKSLF